MAVFTSIIRHRLTDVIIYGERTGDVEVVRRIIVGRSATIIAEAEDRTCTQTSDCHAAGMLLDYLNGSIVDLCSINIALGAVSPFQSAVLSAARRIPYGTVCSYSELAEMAGAPRAVRPAATAMRRNPLPLLIPCHRVIRSDGSIGAYCGDESGEDAALKKALLRMELSALKKRCMNT